MSIIVLHKNYFFHNGLNYKKESSLNKIRQHSENGFFVISAFRNENTEKINLDLTNNLKQDLKQLSLGFISLIGGFPETTETGNIIPAKEISLFIPYKNKIQLSEDEFRNIAVDLCIKYNQESVLYCDPNTKIIGFLDQSGNIEGNLGKFSLYKLGDYWSELKGGNKNQRKKYVFEGYHSPVGANGTRLAELKGEII
jgi:hypothetical protein